MVTGKTSTMSLRIEADLKEALRAASEQKHRSNSMVEVMTRNYCREAGIKTEPTTRVGQARKKS